MSTHSNLTIWHSFLTLYYSISSALAATFDCLCKHNLRTPSITGLLPDIHDTPPLSMDTRQPSHFLHGMAVALVTLTSDQPKMTTFRNSSFSRCTPEKKVISYHISISRRCTKHAGWIETVTTTIAGFLTIISLIVDRVRFHIVVFGIVIDTDYCDINEMHVRLLSWMFAYIIRYSMM